jgi:hypothetical protein
MGRIRAHLRLGRGVVIFLVAGDQVLNFFFSKCVSCMMIDIYPEKSPHPGARARTWKTNEEIKIPHILAEIGFLGIYPNK